jgi:dTDP-4-dehydrorhamnose 3,5-epimerase
MQFRRQTERPRRLLSGQKAPFSACSLAETNLVRRIRGALYDVILDLHKESATFAKSFGAELTADNRRMYVPKGVARGFITLAELVQEHLDTDLRPMRGRRVKRRLSQDLKRGVSRPQFGIHRAMLSRCAFCQTSSRLGTRPGRFFVGNGARICYPASMRHKKKASLTGTVVDAQSRAWRTPVERELDGLFGELAAFNERIAELMKDGHQSHAIDVLNAQALSLAAQIDELRSLLVVPKQ